MKQISVIFQKLGDRVNTALGTNVADMSVYVYTNRSVQPSASWKKLCVENELWNQQFTAHKTHRICMF